MSSQNNQRGFLGAEYQTVKVPLEILRQAVNDRLGSKYRVAIISQVLRRKRGPRSLQEIVAIEHNRILKEFAEHFMAEFNQPQILVKSGDRANAGI